VCSPARPAAARRPANPSSTASSRRSTLHLP
jgi:hypothetical protein